MSNADACLAGIVAALPGFVPTRRVVSLKCVVAFGSLAGARVCVKALHHRDPVWAWYFAREQSLLERLPSDVAAPRVRAHVEGLLVVDELPGVALARYRRVVQPLPAIVLRSCLALAERVEALALGETAPPEPALVRTMRARLLEDPSAPLGWCHAGFDRCVALGHLTPRQASRMHAALDAYPQVRSNHGDFLPRNLIADAEGRVAACDWECAGLHARDWDRALLWANVHARDRVAIEACVAEPAARGEAFRALAAFALARELEFAGRATAARRAGLADQITALLA